MLAILAPAFVIIFFLHDVKLGEFQDAGNPDEKPEKIVKAEVK